MPDVNSMQAHMGLLPNLQSPVGYQTPTSADAAVQLMAQSDRQRMSSMQAVSASVGQQFQRQMGMIQAQQAMNPYGAQMAASMSQGGQGYMPSPLMMTPASTGVFRTPAPQAMSSIPSMYRPPVPFSPFQPRMPAPMFQTPYDQQARMEDMRANQMFAYGSQAPGVAGQAMGLGAGAMLGARFGARFGGAGRIAGAIGGAALAGYSGVSQGLGDFFQSFTRPMVQTRQMGAGIQNMSRSWVVSGQGLHSLGQGLSRDASISLAGQVRGMAADSGFQQETGEMFNRQDLMQIMQRGGRAGLFDMAQSVPQIKQQLRETAVTIKQFMELTNNPDVSSVIRDMGRLRQFGLSQQEMVTAAQGMKAYSRAAGTTIGGLQQIGGLPGAMTFQQAGLTAGTGYQYGNFAAASARQWSASGDMSNRQLALLGGVQGIAQRDMQAQAAFSSMPMFAAMNAQYGAGGWGVNRGAAGQAGQGAFGMVQGSLQALNQATRTGGLGALASFPLMRRQIADEATANMTPEQLMVQRFQMAQQTGKRLGLQGEGAFAAGSRMMYGDEVAEQMLMQAKSPGFWRGQQRVVQRRQRELAASQRREAMENAPFAGGLFRDIGEATGITAAGRGVSQFFGDIGEGFEEAGGAVSGLFGGIADTFSDRQARVDSGVYRRRLGGSTGSILSGLARGGAGSMAGAIRATGDRYTRETGLDIGLSSAALVNAQNLKDEGLTGRMAQVAQYATAPIQLAGDVLGFKPDIGAAAAAIGVQLSTPDLTDQMAMTRKYIKEASSTLEIIDRAKTLGGVEKNVTSASLSLEKALGEKGRGLGLDVLQTAGNKLDKLVYDRGRYGEQLTSSDYRKVLKTAVMESTGASGKEADRIVSEMENRPEVMREIQTQMTHFARTDSRDSSTWLTAQEEDPRTAIMDQITEATESRTERLRDSRESLEASLDLDSFWGQYSGEEKKIQALAAKGGGKEFALKAAAAQAITGGRNRTKWRALVKKHGISSKEQQRIMGEVRKLAKTDEGLAERLGDISARGTAEQVEEYATSLQREGFQAAFAAPEFVEKFGKFSAGLESYLGTEGTEITAGGIAQQFTEKELTQMGKEGGAFGRNFSALLRKAKKGDVKAQEQLTRYALEQQKMSEEGVTETQLSKASGEEARKLEASEEALEGASAAFKDFAPAAKEFAAGAKMLKEAMDSDLIQQAIGDD